MKERRIQIRFTVRSGCRFRFVFRRSAFGMGWISVGAAGELDGGEGRMWVCASRFVPHSGNSSHGTGPPRTSQGRIAGGDREGEIALAMAGFGEVVVVEVGGGGGWMEA